MTTSIRPPSRPSSTPATPRVLLADRGDALVGPLSAAMRRRFDVVGHLDTELTQPERWLVAASTFAPGRPTWAERFYKSNLAVDLRTRRARTGLADVEADVDVVFQTHALFEVADPRAVMYVDCTHQQSMDQWPAWNPLRGRALQRWLARERRQYHRAAHVFAFSQETGLSLLREYGVPVDRVSVVGAGVNFERLPVLREAGDRPPTVLFVGNDFERKGGPRLLEAFARVRRRVPRARLRLVGTPHPIAAQDGVEQVGRVHSRAQMSRLFASADVFCLPSYYDPFPGALLEAMAYGLPSVVTTTCGVPEIVEDGVTALTVDQVGATVAELAASLEHLLLHRDEAAEMGMQARWRVEDRFLWSHVVDRMAPVIEELSADSRAAGWSTRDAGERSPGPGSSRSRPQPSQQPSVRPPVHSSGHLRAAPSPTPRGVRP